MVKNAGEAFLHSYKKEYDLDYTIFRFFNTYGPKQSIDFVMSRFIAMALKDQNITIFGDGKQTRTFCYIDDNIDACVNAFYEDKVVNDIMNVGGDIEITILELAEKIIKISGSKSKIIHLPALEEGDMLRRYPDVTKMHAILKRQPYSMEEGIKKILENTQYIIR